jgi:hypothetical protein
MSRNFTDPRKRAARKRAQRAFPTHSLPPCRRCGAPPGRYPRHHPDIENNPDLVIILCDACHQAIDRNIDKWGKGAPPPKRPGPRTIAPLAPVQPGPVDLSRPPLLVLCGTPGSGKTTLAHTLGLDPLQRAGYIEIGEVHRWLDASTSKLAAIEHVGVSEDVHGAICSHVARTKRPALIVVCYVGPNTRHNRILRRPESPDCTRHELSAWADRVAWVLKQLYPPQRAFWLNNEAPPQIGAGHVKRELDHMIGGSVYNLQHGRPADAAPPPESPIQ